MTKTIRFITIALFTLVCVQLWALAVSAADTSTVTRKLADGSTETCTYQKDFVQTADGSHMIRHAWRCVRTASK